MLVDAFVTASRVLISVAVRSIDTARPELTLARHRILVLLAARGSQRIGDLARELAVNSSNATRHCDRLQGLGLLERRRVVEDGRAVCVALTPAGRELVDRVTDVRRAEIAAILETMSDQDRVGLLAALRAFGDAAGELPDSAWVSGWD